MRRFAGVIVAGLALAACGGGGGGEVRGHIDQAKMCEVAWDSGGKDLAEGQSKAEFVKECVAELDSTETSAP